MSAKNIEIARPVIGALNRGDVSGAMEDLAADFVFDFSRSISPERGVYGREDIPRFMEAFAGLWESVRYEVDEFIADGDRIITPVITRNRGRDGIELHSRVAWVWSFRDGRIARITFFQDRRDALEAAGLSE